MSELGFDRIIGFLGNKIEDSGIRGHVVIYFIKPGSGEKI